MLFLQGPCAFPHFLNHHIVSKINNINIIYIFNNVLTFVSKHYRCCTLVSLCEDQSPREEDMAEVVQREMEAMDLAIRDAVDKFTRLLENSRANDTGMQLEVNFVALLLWYVSGLQRRWEKVLKIHC